MNNTSHLTGIVFYVHYTDKKKFMRLSFKVLFLVLCLGVPLLLLGNDYQFKILENSASKIRMVVTFDQPQIVLENGMQIARYKHSQPVVADGNYVVPHIVRFFNLPVNSNAQPRILSVKQKRIKIPNYFKVKSDSTNPLTVTSVVTAQYMGKLNSIPVHALHFYPVKYDEATSMLIWTESIELEVDVPKTSAGASNITQVSGNKNKLTSSLFVNSPSALYKTEKVGSLAKSTSEALGVNPILDKQKIFKIAVDKTGLYKITYDDLVEADYPVDNVDPKRLSLYLKGTEVPIYFKGAEDGQLNEQDYFEFWGKKNEKTFLDEYPDQYSDPFSDENIYWLVENSNNGRRLVEESGALIQSTTGIPILTPASFTDVLHFEKNNYPEKFGKNGSFVDRPTYYLDQWYFDSGVRAPEGGSYNFYVPNPYEYGNDVIITAVFRGKSYYEYGVNPLEGHKVDLKLRGKNDIAKLVGVVNPEDKWHDQAMQIITNADSALKLSQSMLNDGTNSLEVDMFQTGVSDAVLLNWFDISYLRKFIAYKDQLKFTIDEKFYESPYVKLGDPVRFSIDGFTNKNIDLYKIGVSKIVSGQVKKIEDGNKISYRLSFQDEIFDTDVNYVALTENAKLKPLSIEAYTGWLNGGPNSNLLNDNNAAEYLIITDNLLQNTCLRLKNLKEADGYQTKIVTVENIYDTFNFGIKSPIAIKEFIKYVVENWDQNYPLQYVVFVGDASYDYKGIYGQKTDLVPTFMFQTVDFGATGSDYLYSLLDDDYIPDVSVARIPAQNNQQLSNYLDKVESYSQNNDFSQWRNRALFISGKDVSSSDLDRWTNQPIFRSQNLRLIDMQLPDPIFPSRLNTIQDEVLGENDPNFGSTTDLIEYFDDGVSFINFLGHGGGSIWADVNLLNLDEVGRLNNGSRLPFIASMTCFTGAFENPVDGLAERLVMSENKGAIAVLASSGFGWKYNDMATEWGLFDYLWDDLTFGQAVSLMKIYYLANPVYYTENGGVPTPSYYTLNKTMVSQYNLLGDPALKLLKPKNLLNVSIDNNNPLPGDSVNITISGGPSNGTGKLEVVDRKNLLIFAANFQHQSNGASVSFKLADTLEADLLTAKAYATNGIEDASGSLEIGLARSVIKKIETTPSLPKVNEPISFEMDIASDAEIASVKLYNFRDFNNLNTYNFEVTTQKISSTMFKSDVDFPGFTNSGLKYFDILVRDTAGVEEIYRWRKLKIVDDRPDFKIIPNSLAYTGTNQLQIKFSVLNDSEFDLTDLAIDCFSDKGIEENTAFSESVVSLKASEEKTISVNFDSTSFKKIRNFKIVLDPQNHYAERNEDNNILQEQLTTDHIFIQPQIGSSINGIENDTLVLADNWKFFVAKDTLTQPSVVKFTESNLFDFQNEITQKELTPVRLDGSNNYLTADLSIGNFSPGLNFISSLSAKVNVSADSLNHVAFYIYDNFLSLWVQVPTDTIGNGNILMTKIRKPGMYSIFYNADDKVPYIEVSSNGHPLVKNFLVVRKPVISILLQDESGINLNNSFTLQLDDQALVSDGIPIKSDVVNYPDSLENSKTISILATPELESGQHTLSVGIADVNGNYSEEQVTFSVSSLFEINIYGNYPNPFSDQTIISYYVNSDNDLDKFSVKIYTTSGRLIRTKPLDTEITQDEANFDLTKAVGYHELVWYGDDDDGKQVANGVYFAVIKGSYRGKTISHTLKIARLQ